VYLVEELKKNKIEDNFRLFKVVVETTTFFDVLFIDKTHCVLSKELCHQGYLRVTKSPSCYYFTLYMLL
ncbi:hypothetical protein, partial [uncultured Clostridium sp.]|uniref:hypothetical protein n=1 Tax=uncultured Clostridium sp. TaxID=59620 RepID=UPI002587FAC7